jgi:hypothetical protein
MTPRPEILAAFGANYLDTIVGILGFSPDQIQTIVTIYFFNGQSYQEAAFFLFFF